MTALYYVILASALALVVILWRGYARTHRLLADHDLSADSGMATDSFVLEIGPNLFHTEDGALVESEASPAFSRKFREERTALALAWLRRVRRSVNAAMRFHAESARSRADLSVSSELKLALEFVAFHAALGVLYCAVSLQGPFQVAALARYSTSLAGRLKQSAGELAPSPAPQVP